MFNINIKIQSSSRCSQSQRQSSRWSSSRVTENSDVIQFKVNKDIYH